MQWIDDCINSVINESTVIIIDNNSSDATVQHIKSHYPNVILLPQQENLGFGAGNNLGISLALNKGAEHILLLNQDAKMGVSALAKSVTFQKKNKTFGMVSPIHCDWTGLYLEKGFDRYVSYENNPDFYADHVLSHHIKEVYPVKFIAAACWVLSRKMLLEVGGFDPLFFHIGEDSNYCQRVLFHKFKIGVLPGITVCHDTRGRTYRNHELFTDKYYKYQDYHSKIKLANVNLPNSELMVKGSYKVNQLRKQILLALITLNLTTFKGYFRELKQYKSIIKASIDSATLNRKRDSHYLKLDN